jgi:hypothetical protein
MVIIGMQSHHYEGPQVLELMLPLLPLTRTDDIAWVEQAASQHGTVWVKRNWMPIQLSATLGLELCWCSCLGVC